MWVAIAVLVFVVTGVFKKQEKKQGNSLKEREAGCQNCSPYRSATSDTIPLSNVNSSPSKLSKGVISENKFVQIRKTSMDMTMDIKPVATIQVPEALQEEEEKEEVAKPRRKISNVHFALTMAGQNTPPVPHTPPIEHKASPQFAFANRVSLDHTVDQDDSYSDEEDSSGSQMGESVDGSEPPETPKTPATPLSVDQDVRCSVDSMASTGSIRITRHSNRAHTKATEIFQRSNSIRASKNKIPLVNTPSPLTQHSVSHPPNTPPPTQRQESVSSRESSSSDPEDAEDSIKKWPDTSAGCPIHQTNDISPLLQRRTRKTAIVLDQPDQSALLLPPPGPRATDIFRRSPSRSPTRKRTQRDMLVDNALQSVMSMSEDAIVCANAQGELVFWSAGAVKMFGYTPGEAIGSSLQVRPLSSCPPSSHRSMSHVFCHPVE